MKVELVSASAGTGKTYTITTDLAQRVISDAVRPVKVLATTFTVKAAAELQQRARQVLLEASEQRRAEGKQAEAARLRDKARDLQAARIGTIDSVCLGLVEDHAFEAGLSPGLRILDSDEAQRLLGKVLGEALSTSDIEELDLLQRRMVDFDWSESVLSLIEAARSNGLSAGELSAQARRSVDGIRKLIKVDATNPTDLDQGLMVAIKRFLKSVPKADSTQKTRELVRVAGRALDELKRESFPWSLWAKLAKGEPGRKSKAAYQQVLLAADAHARHPRMRFDVERAATLCHEIAAEALASYQEEMAMQGLSDFVEIESRALDLLRRPEICDRLRGDIDLLLVDEFQDTSPIQLEIFVRLGELAKEAIWVGDQKQAIYGFRGTDPALMNAVVERAAGGGAPRILDQSWRSLPALVDLTTRLFVPAFARHGIDTSLVRVTAAEKKPWPDPFGPVLEHWQLESKNKQQDCAALAGCVRALLEDSSQRVRDRDSEELRRLCPGDLAILCRDNKTARELANALSSEGIASNTERPGLENRTEVLAALAAFRFYLDPSDELARAELSRYLIGPAQPQAWFEALTRKGDPTIDRLAEFRALRAAHKESFTGSACASLDLALEALRIDDLCRAWGDAELRLANLERLRAVAHAHEQAYLQRGRSLAPAGLLLFLEEIEEDQASPLGTQSVHVGTWHAAKGLEWPMVVLFQLDQERKESALGVHVMPREEGFELDSPLAGRWLRYWPWPYHRGNSGLPLNASIDASAETKRIRTRAEEQELRLLYVGWTRARDRLILAARPGKLCAAALSLLPGFEERDGGLYFEGEALEAFGRTGTPGEGQVPAPQPSPGPLSRKKLEHPRAFLSPSEIGIAATTEPSEVISMGERLSVADDVDMRLVGEALHAFLACDDPNLEASFRQQLAREQFEERGVPNALEAGNCILASDRLHAWVQENWPGSRLRREWPVLRRIESGSLLRGYVDLVIETDSELIVVDHKSFPGSREQGLEEAKTYAGQLGEYAAALAASGDRPVTASFVHLPLLGLLARL
ncbi:MAG: UvrD-helicase domain-containing protein [Planctomycetota bacterium]